MRKVASERQAQTQVNLLLAAFAPELAGISPEDLPGWRVATVGIGALNAALETARLICEFHPRRVLVVGTCGAYGEQKIGEIFWARRALASSVEETSGKAYRPQQEQTVWEATDMSLKAHFPSADVVVTPAITRSREGAATLGRLGDLEHLELTGIFAACHQAGVPVSALLTVANRVGPEAHKEWLSHHGAVSRQLMDRLSALL